MHIRNTKGSSFCWRKKISDESIFLLEKIKNTRKVNRKDFFQMLILKLKKNTGWFIICRNKIHDDNSTMGRGKCPLYYKIIPLKDFMLFLKWWNTNLNCRKSRMYITTYGVTTEVLKIQQREWRNKHYLKPKEVSKGKTKKYCTYKKQ